MNESKIKIESDGKTANIFIDGKEVKSTEIDFRFHGDVDNGVHISWDCECIKTDNKGFPIVKETEIIKEHIHYDSLECD